MELNINVSSVHELQIGSHSLGCWNAINLSYLFVVFLALITFNVRVVACYFMNN